MYLTGCTGELHPLYLYFNFVVCKNKYLINSHSAKATNDSEAKVSRIISLFLSFIYLFHLQRNSVTTHSIAYKVNKTFVELNLFENRLRVNASKVL